jgi:lysozyme family protein
MTAENKTACVDAIDGHEWSSSNSANDMWTAISGDDLPKGVDMVVLDNAMVAGSEEALACLAAIHSRPLTEYLDKTPHDQVILSYTMERLDRMEQGDGQTESNTYARINKMQELALSNIDVTFEAVPPPPTHNNPH